MEGHKHILTEKPTMYLVYRRCFTQLISFNLHNHPNETGIMTDIFENK